MATTDTKITRIRTAQTSKHKKNTQSWLVQSMAILLIASSLMGIAGCTMLAKEPRVIVEPRLLTETDIEGTVQGADLPANSVSPDGTRFLAVKDDANGSHLVIMAADGKDFEVVFVESVSKDWLSDSWFSYRPLGWTSDTEFVYAKMGWQPTGTHKGERGVTLAIGRLPGEGGKSEMQPGSDDPAKASTEEAAFFPLPYRDSSLKTLFLPSQNKIYLNNNTTIWQFDIAEKNLAVLKSGLPNYIYRQPIASPKGNYFVYELNEKGKNGIFIFDTATLEERPLIPNEDTMSFYPAWSFDGQYIAAYTVEKKEGEAGTSWHNYLLFEGEDTAQSIGSSITVVDTKGTVVDNIQIEGKYLQYFQWSQNSHTIGFLAGSEIPKEKTFPRAVVSESVWIAQIEKPSKQSDTLIHLGDIPKGNDGTPPYTWPVTFDADSKGILCNIHENGTWYFSKNAEPSKIFDGLWPSWEAEITPVYGNSMVALTDKEQLKKEFYLFNNGQSTKFGETESPWAWVVACTDTKLILFVGDIDDNLEESSISYLAYPKKGKLAVYNMIEP